MIGKVFLIYILCGFSFSHCMEGLVRIGLVRGSSTDALPYGDEEKSDRINLIQEGILKRLELRMNKLDEQNSALRLNNRELAVALSEEKKENSKLRQLLLDLEAKNRELSR